MLGAQSEQDITHFRTLKEVRDKQSRRRTKILEQTTAQQCRYPKIVLPF